MTINQNFGPRADFGCLYTYIKVYFIFYFSGIECNTNCNVVEFTISKITSEIQWEYHGAVVQYHQNLKILVAQNSFREDVCPC
jgi:hypothetical protein